MTLRRFGAPAAIVVSLAVGLVLAGGCEKVRPPLAPGTDGSTDGSRVPPPRRDGGGADSASDAAPTDAAAGDAAPTDAAAGDAVVDSGAPDVGLPRGCYLAGTDTGTDAVVSVGGEPVSFPVNRAYATWDSAECRVPTLVVGLTTSSCIPSIGERLVFSIVRDHIGTTLFPGENIIVAEPDDLGLTVRLDLGGETWGTCLGSGATGSVNFTSIDSLPGSRLTGTFAFTLGDCRDPLTSAPVQVTGSFDVPLEIPFASVCL